MKWIKNRQSFLNEAKLRDVLHKRQIKEVTRQWGEKYLDYEEVDPTDKIKQGRWKLSEEDKIKVLSFFFSSNYDDTGIDMNVVFDTFKNLPDKFANILGESFDIEIFRNEQDKEKFGIIFKDFNPKSPTIDQISCLYEPVFRKLSTNDTRATSVIQKDENGRPIKDEEGNMLRVEKEAGAPIFERNLVNIKGFVESYNRCYESEKVDENIFYTNEIQNIISFAKENHNREYKIDFEIFNRDMYLSMNHNATDILNMSISTFYSSCQHLYSGGYRGQLLANVFDPNSIPAFLIFDTPIFWDDEKISDFLPLSRMMVRSIESFNSDETKIFFDRAYPDRMKKIFGEIVEKYSGNKENYNGGNYVFAPDVDPNDELRTPYMDRLGLSKVPFIGKNTKSLYLNRNHDWSKIKISPSAKIKEIVIETEDLPENFTDIKLNPDWIKFKYMTITSMEPFKSVSTDSLAFDKCKFDTKILQDLSSELKKIQIISCDLKGDLDLSMFKNLEEIHLIYTLDDLEDLQKIIEGDNLKKLVVSGDLFSSTEGKDYLKSLKSRIKVELVGPVV